jgi:hypothetical protein
MVDRRAHEVSVDAVGTAGHATGQQQPSSSGQTFEGLVAEWAEELKARSGLWRNSTV